MHVSKHVSVYVSKGGATDWRCSAGSGMAMEVTSLPHDMSRQKRAEESREDLACTGQDPMY
jgi:hypothetical protein